MTDEIFNEIDMPTEDEFVPSAEPEQQAIPKVVGEAPVEDASVGEEQAAPEEPAAPAEEESPAQEAESAAQEDEPAPIKKRAVRRRVKADKPEESSGNESEDGEPAKRGKRGKKAANGAQAPLNGNMEIGEIVGEPTAASRGRRGVESAPVDRDDVADSLSADRLVTQTGAKIKLGKGGSDTLFSMTENFVNVRDAMRRNLICSAPLDQVVSERGTGPEGDSVVVNYLGFLVTIPFSNFFTEEDNAAIERSFTSKMESNGVNKQNYLRSKRVDYARSMIGYNVPFIIDSATSVRNRNRVSGISDYDAEYIITGNRLKALGMIRHLNFFSALARSNPIKAGDVVDCDVVGASNTEVRVITCGVSAVIHRKHLSLLRWVRPIADYRPGMSFRAVVTNCEIDYAKQSVKLELSRLSLPSEVDAANFYLRNYNGRDLSSFRFSGTVAIVVRDKDGYPLYYGINLNTPPIRAIVRVSMNAFQNLTPGEEVVFTAQRVDVENKALSGVCRPKGYSNQRGW